MDSYVFAAGLRLQSHPNVTSPPAAKAKPGSVNMELSDLSNLAGPALPAEPSSMAFTPAGPQTPAEALTHGFQTPREPNDIEGLQTPADVHVRSTGVVPSFSYPPMNKWRVLCACLTYFGNGMSDSAAGPIIPYMESYYHIGYALVSLIFITNAVGFIITAFGTNVIQSRLGRARSLMLSEIVMAAAYIIIACTPPFPVVVVAYLFMGLGNALNLALNNVFAANLANSTVILGAAHGSYGVGGIVAPIIATAMLSKGVLWSRFFIILLGIRFVTFFFTGWANNGYESEPTNMFSTNLENVARRRRQESGEPSSWQLLKDALKNKTTVIGALFIFAYQGAEVSISGWVISYLISARGGDPAHVGYVTSGFWGGITLGRFVLSYAAPRVGEKLFVYILIAGVIGFQLLVWFVPNVVGDAIAVSILGLLLGPVYPCSQTVFTLLLPASIQMSSISFISSAGSSGGAVAPFMTGLSAQAVGTFVLHPICIALFAVMAGCWFALPKVIKRTE